MSEKYLWTPLKARLQLIKETSNASFNWLFLPGGPGLGSQSLNPLTQLLDLPGTMWNLDLPGDGSNLIKEDDDALSRWSEALTEAVASFDNVILVAHSTGGMYALATDALENLLTGLVLMDSAPDALWQINFMNHVIHHPIAEMEKLQNIYQQNPNNELLKQIVICSVPYLFTPEGLTKDLSFLNTLPYNFRSCDWSAQHFDSTYKAKWIPKNIHTLIFAGEKDCITPIDLFKNSGEFQNPNILIRTIKDAGHFPWIEQPKAVKKLFEEYYQRITENQ